MLKQAQSLAQQHNCQLIPLDFQQESGMISCLPLGHNAIRIQRGLTTSSTAIFVPFTTQELFQTSKEALYERRATESLQRLKTASKGLDGLKASLIWQAIEKALELAEMALERG